MVQRRIEYGEYDRYRLKRCGNYLCEYKMRGHSVGDV
jgi:hypothetical protein